jgi:hypothetical protein
LIDGIIGQIAGRLIAGKEVQMTQKLIGKAFLNKGRIDFGRQENPWAFKLIDSGMKESQKDRILVDPQQAVVELISGSPKPEETPSWLGEMQEILRSADSIYLQYKSGVLRFRRAIHLDGSDREFVTLGNQDEFELYAKEHWNAIRYLYALRRPGAFCFDIHTMITYRNAQLPADCRQVEIPARLDFLAANREPNISFDSSGHHATNEIVEWRGTVKEGEVGRYAPEGTQIQLAVSQVNRPFTFLHENRREFKNHSYTFNGGNVREQFRRLLKKRLAQRQA